MTQSVQNTTSVPAALWYFFSRLDSLPRQIIHFISASCAATAALASKKLIQALTTIAPIMDGTQSVQFRHRSSRIEQAECGGSRSILSAGRWLRLIEAIVLYSLLELILIQPVFACFVPPIPICVGVLLW